MTSYRLLQREGTSVRLADGTSRRSHLDRRDVSERGVVVAGVFVKRMEEECLTNVV